jgi:hypothetical protein
MMNDYSIGSIKVLPYPPLQKSTDEWERVWKVEVVEKLPSVNVINDFIKSRKEDILFVSVSLITEHEVSIRIVSKKHGGSDDVMFATYRLFNEFDKKLYKIKKIEGKQKEEWPAFKYKWRVS